MPRRDEWGAERPSALERIYDGLALLLLMWPATGGMWLLGSTRTWGFAPGLAVSFLGSLLVLVRPLVFRDVPRAVAPAGFWIFAALSCTAARNAVRKTLPLLAGHGSHGWR